MVFNSLIFAAFFALVWVTVALLATDAAERRLGARRITLRNAFLLVASYVFYGAWDWRFLSLIAVSTLVDYLCGRGMAAHPSDLRFRRNLVVLSVFTNLSILGFFKYFDFFVGSATEALAAVGIETRVQSLQIVLPVGISFYTFQTLSYTIDIYRGRMEGERSLLNFATYVAFFPQLVAGPIERARRLLPQFSQPTRITPEQLQTGGWLIAWGLFKKVVVADNSANVANSAFALEDPTGLQVLVGAWAFAVQIYCDFSGYTDIARGAARCLGFELSLNFNLPYVAATPSEFWQRWHISLSSWLRDYLYISLGGNRRGSLRTYVNLMLTMLLGGLWHGAAWNFVAWGAFHGGLLIVYRRLAGPVTALLPPLGSLARRAVHAVAVLWFFHLVCISWILFRANSLGQAMSMCTALLTEWSFGAAAQLAALDRLGLATVVTAILLAAQALQLRYDDHLIVLRLPLAARAVVYAAGALAFLYLGEFGGDAFIYFQF